MHFAQSHHFGPVQSLQMGVGYFAPPPVKVHAFLVDGLLIDTGPPKLEKELLAWLEDKPFQQAFITHHHEDHSGNVNGLHRQFQRPIFGSAACSRLVQGQVRTSIPQLIYWGRPRYTNKVQPYTQNLLHTEHHQFQLIPIPGHADDQVALFEPQQGWLFSADAFVHPYIKYYMRYESMRQQINSLQKLIALDFEQLFCCHTPLMKGGKKQLQQKLAYLQNYYAQVVHWHHKGCSPREIMAQMQQKERWGQYLLSGGYMAAINMVKAVLRDEQLTKANE